MGGGKAEPERAWLMKAVGRGSGSTKLSLGEAEGGLGQLRKGAESRQ